MQTITMYLRAASVKGTLVDEWNQQVNSLPALTRGLRAELVLKLVDTNGDALEGLDSYASWDFAIADDWDTATKPQIRVVEGITVTDNEVHIPLTETNTEELIEALGNNESATFGCELAGFETGETQPGFLLQFDISMRNRRCDAGTGTPVPVTDANYSAAQVDALFASKFSVEISTDLETWGKIPPGTTEVTDARWFHIRNAEVERDWSDPIPLIVGPRGERSTIQVGTVDAGEPGTAPVVANTGDEHDAVFDFTIPQGEKGDTATVSVGTVELVESTKDAEVTNSGDEHDAVLDFKIQRGADWRGRRERLPLRRVCDGLEGRRLLAHARDDPQVPGGAAHDRADSAPVLLGLRRRDVGEVPRRRRDGLRRRPRGGRGHERGQGKPHRVRERELWAAFRDWLDETDYADLFGATQDIREDNPAFRTGLAAAMTRFGIPLAEANAILDESVAD